MHLVPKIKIYLNSICTALTVEPQGRLNTCSKEKKQNIMKEKLIQTDLRNLKLQSIVLMSNIKSDYRLYLYQR